MNITKRWKRALFVGCSHGSHADPVAIDAVLRFRESYNPHAVIHLGDFTDMTAFRSGAKGTADQSAPVDPDVDAGLDFLEKLEVTTVMAGNHENRLWIARESNDAVVAHAASTIVQGIQTHCNKLKADLIPYTGIWQGKMLGNYRLMHGVFFSENASRDHAEAFGNCIHAHTHRAAIAKGRRSDNPTAFCVGTLTRSSDASFAQTRKSTLAWSQGFVFGEFCDTHCQLWLHENQVEGNWKLPS